MNVGKGNTAMWYRCVICGREKAMVSIIFTRNSYGWVSAATQESGCDLGPGDFARRSQSVRHLWRDSDGFHWKIHRPAVGSHVLWGRVSSMMWDRTSCCVLELWMDLILGLVWNGHLTNGDQWIATETYDFENICVFYLQDLPLVQPKLFSLDMISACIMVSTP